MDTNHDGNPFGNPDRNRGTSVTLRDQFALTMAPAIADEVLRLDKAATPGPWVWRSYGCLVGDYGCRPIVLDAGEWTIRVGKRTDDMGGLMVPINEAPDHPDTSLIATYREAAPALAREVLRLQAECDRLRNIIRDIKANSDGLAGYHLNGDIAHWDDPLLDWFDEAAEAAAKEAT